MDLLRLDQAADFLFFDLQQMTVRILEGR